MFHSAMRYIFIAAALLMSTAASAEPITLKLSFFTSDRSNIYQKTVKPFVDAVNDEGQHLIEIETDFSSAIAKVQVEQAQLVADGTVELAIIVPGLTPERFSDTSVMELPGIYHDAHEASLVFTRLVQAGALKGYNDFFVVGAFVSGAEAIHSRKPIAANKDLKTLTIRTNNQIEMGVLERLGATPVLLAINRTTDAISRGAIDGATLPPAMVFEFGIGRVTTNHYMIQLGGAPTALVMNCKKFESLPPKAQAVIRKYSGPWLADKSATGMAALDKLTLEKLESDPRRKVTFPSSSDLKSTQRVYASVTEDWAAKSAHNRELLGMVEAELAKIRSRP